LTVHEFRVHDVAVTGHVDRVGSADTEQAIKGVRPRRHVRVGIDRRVAGFLDEVTTENHDPLAVITRHHYDQIRVGVAAPQMCDRQLAIPEVDDGVVDGVLGRPQRRDRAVDLTGVGPVAQRVVAKLVSRCCDVSENIWCTIYLSFSECPGA
jgi:hypothetical protein